MKVSRRSEAVGVPNRTSDFTIQWVTLVRVQKFRPSFFNGPNPSVALNPSKVQGDFFCQIPLNHHCLGGTRLLVYRFSKNQFLERESEGEAHTHSIAY